ncbi:M48 family metallopeptidase [Coralliovum pocilloporae]|uniref:M48 family metallopeptidase n=1 Tax=Coralliovum pocilloporae TaxID=3066369 RepID=UPI003306E7BD
MELVSLFSRVPTPAATLPTGLEQVLIPYGQGQIPVLIRRNKRSRRMTLRIDRAKRAVVLTIPASLPRARAESFIRKETAWICERFDELPGPVPITPGAVIPIRGKSHHIVSTGQSRGRVAVRVRGGENDLLVPGDPRHLERRVLDFLKGEARADFQKAVSRHAAELGVAPSAIRIRDQKTRWGSCSSNGTLSFSWRLVLAPPEILDYLAAHEVSHLLEMNHSAQFWAHCRRQAPQTDQARAWLREHGEELHMIGQQRVDGL